MTFIMVAILFCIFLAVIALSAGSIAAHFEHTCVNHDPDTF